MKASDLVKDKTALAQHVKDGYAYTNQVQQVKSKLSTRLQQHTPSGPVALRRASSIIKEIIIAIAAGILIPVPDDTIRDMRNNFEALSQYYRERFLFTPVFFRFGSLVLAFNPSELPGVVAELITMISNKSITPEPEAFMEFRSKYPGRTLEIYEGIEPLEVWIQDQLFIFDTSSWNGQTDINFLRSMKLFGNKSGWQ